MESAIVGAKGQVVIPQKIRGMFQIKPGTHVHFEARGGEIVLTPLTPWYFERMAGCLGTGGKAPRRRSLRKGRRNEIRTNPS